MFAKLNYLRISGLWLKALSPFLLKWGCHLKDQHLEQAHPFPLTMVRSSEQPKAELCSERLGEETGKSRMGRSISLCQLLGRVAFLGQILSQKMKEWNGLARVGSFLNAVINIRVIFLGKITFPLCSTSFGRAWLSSKLFFTFVFLSVFSRKHFYEHLVMRHPRTEEGTDVISHGIVTKGSMHPRTTSFIFSSP